jgi:hypothetical protein
LSRFGYESYKNFENPEEVIQESPYEFVETDESIQFGRRQDRNEFENMIRNIFSIRLPREKAIWNKIGGFLEQRVNLQALSGFHAEVVYHEEKGTIYAMDEDAERYLDRQEERYRE